MSTQPKVAISIQSKAGENSFGAAAGERLLYAGLAHGLTLPYECATGTCGTCRARIMSGSVETLWAGAPGAKKLNRDKGDVLLCQCSASTDCVVRVPAHVTEAMNGPLPLRYAARIDTARRLTPDVIHLELDLSGPMTFQSGQFAVIEHPDIPGGRAWSMVNFGVGLGRLAFVVKRKPGGAMGDWLFDSEVHGATVAVFGPLGRAVWLPSEARDILAIAGGSGIAGIMSILEHATLVGHFAKHRGHVFFGVRTRAEAFYMAELAGYVDRSAGNLEVTVALSHEDVPAGATEAGIRLAGGFVHEVARSAMSGRFGDLTAFLAGPGPMVDGAIRMLLVDAKLSSDRIRYDKFA